MMLTSWSSSGPVSTRTVSYLAASTLDQNSSRQLDGIVLDRLVTDKVSGKDLHRPELHAMISFVRDGDTVLVHSMDRLARNADPRPATRGHRPGQDNARASPWPRSAAHTAAENPP